MYSPREKATGDEDDAILLNWLCYSFCVLPLQDPHSCSAVVQGVHPSQSSHWPSMCWTREPFCPAQLCHARMSVPVLQECALL